MLDPIYNESDAVDVSLGKRKKAGSDTSTIVDKTCTGGLYFFTLR